MTRGELEQLKWLKIEVERAKTEYLNARPVYESDSVYGSTEANPENRVIVIKGYTYRNIESKLKKYERAIEKLDDEVDRLEEWIESIPDSLTRQILRLKFRNGLTHEQIGAELGFSSRTIERKLKDFWGE